MDLLLVSGCLFVISVMGRSFCCRLDMLVCHSYDERVVLLFLLGVLISVSISGAVIELRVYCGGVGQVCLACNGIVCLLFK